MRPDDKPQDPVLSLAGWRGRPRGHHWNEEPVLGRRQRLLVFGVLALGHALVVVGMVLASLGGDTPPAQVVTVLEFITPEPPPPPEPEPPVEPVETPPAPAPAPRPRVRPSTPLQAVEPGGRDTPTTPPPERLRLFGTDGALTLPDEVKDQLAEVESADRDFEWRLAGVAEAGEFFDRPPAMEYRETEFEQYWRPHDKDLLTDLLEAAVEATTGEVRIPVPGNPGVSVVCKASLLAVMGACGVVKADKGYQYADPNVLTPEQDRQCEVLWEQIVQASTQEGWRRLRKLYDATCRKPPAKPDPMPPPPR